MNCYMSIAILGGTLIPSILRLGVTILSFLRLCFSLQILTNVLMRPYTSVGKTLTVSIKREVTLASAMTPTAMPTLTRVSLSRNV